MYVPREFIYSARYWNGENHKEAEYWDTFLSNDDYRWDSTTIIGLVYEPSEWLSFDEEGIPQVAYFDEWYYNPVTIAQHGLGLYNRWIEYHSQDDLDSFLIIASWLVDNQAENGSYPYSIPFALKPSLELPKGFVSGMAQGKVLSVLIRAYAATGDEVYLEAGESCLRFMLSNADEDLFAGARKSITDFVSGWNPIERYAELSLPEEYVSSPSSYVLNGDLIALMGLYDWWQGAPYGYGGEDAHAALLEAVEAIKVLLPYYDYCGWSSYDLLQYTHDSTPLFDSNYAHLVHIQMLHYLYNITGDETLAHWRDVFLDYELDDFWRQTDIIAPPMGD